MSRHRNEPSPLPGDVKDRLQSVVENTELLHRQIKEGHCHHGVPLDLSEFHTKFFQAAQQVSDVCTKLSVLYSRPPTPTAEENGVLCRMVEQSALQLASMTYQVSPRHGKVFLGEIQQTAMGILEGVAHLVKSLIKDGCVGSARLRGTGTVWERCDSLAKLSKDNRAAVIRVFISQLHLLKDARSEVEELESSNGLGDRMDDEAQNEALLPPVSEDLSGRVAGMALDDESGGHLEGQRSAESDEDGPREWTETEGRLARPCIGLIQLSSDIVGDACRLIVSHASVDREQFVDELDTAADSIQPLSPVVDELAEELSVPVTMDSCKQLGMRLGMALQGVVDNLSGCHFIKKAEQSWNTDRIRKTVSDILQELQRI